YNFSYYGDILVNFVGWLGTLSCLIIGRLYLNKENNITNYLKKASFPIYILHLPILVIIGYYSLILVNNIALQICTIIFGSFIVTILIYEIIKNIPILKKIIGVR
ncbi:acyltransferase family protein, partial [uncultured Clostridium sp.]|uniref:acyltransferase family protein n=1 Tax=uncultured Clostridium sp. TaxID=59620 RepID=UPI003416CE6E